RSVYDHVLSKRAEEMGCDIHYRTAVRGLKRDGDRIESLTLDDGTEVHAKYYVDCSGHAGILRRNMGVEVEEPSKLRNIAVWNYWRDTEWSVKLCIDRTRIQVMSLGSGWIWYIQIGDDRTSVGFGCPADYYKDSSLNLEELYTKALRDEPHITD